MLVRVQASSVNAIDNAIAAGMLKDMVPHEFPVTLGRDFAGVIEHETLAMTIELGRPGAPERSRPAARCWPRCTLHPDGGD